MTKLLALIAVGVAAACTQQTPTQADTTALVGQEMQITAGLVQRVSLTPGLPTAGQNVRIRSVIVNRGSTRVALESRMCGLDYAGALQLTDPPEMGRCAGYSMSQPLVAGDSVVVFDIKRVESRAGTYVLRIRQALNPESWYEMSIRVAASPTSQ